MSYPNPPWKNSPPATRWALTLASLVPCWLLATLLIGMCGMMLALVVVGYPVMHFVWGALRPVAQAREGVGRMSAEHISDECLASLLEIAQLEGDRDRVLALEELRDRRCMPLHDVAMAPDRDTTRLRVYSLTPFLRVRPPADECIVEVWTVDGTKVMVVVEPRNKP